MIRKGTNSKKVFTVGSMFAGIGGICLAFKKAGCRIVWANEIDRAACKTYRLNFGDKYLVQGNIKNVDPCDIPKFDILTAGFPCQAFSSVGLKDGFDDPRGNLFLRLYNKVGTYERCLQERNAGWYVSF